MIHEFCSPPAAQYKYIKSSRSGTIFLVSQCRMRYNGLGTARRLGITGFAATIHARVTGIHRSVIQSTVIGFCRQQFVVDGLRVSLRLTICSLGMHMNILGGVGGLCTPGYTVSDDALENRLLDTPVTVCDSAKFG